MSSKTRDRKAPTVLRSKRRFPFMRSRTDVVRTPKGALIAELATATRTDRVVVAALQAAHGWDDETRLSREEFVRIRDAWLAAPGRARRGRRSDREVIR